MMNARSRPTLKLIPACTVLVVMGLANVTAAAGQFSAGIPGSWTCTGNCGTLGADGVVTLAPGSGSPYGFVTTYGGVTGVGLGFSGDRNGSVLRTNLFSANAGDKLEFDFNFVTSDGAGFADYAWSVLRDNQGAVTDYLFTARTRASGDIVPGFGLPAASATLTPASTPIIGGGPVWSPLGNYSGSCYSVGCGHTGWVHSSFVFSKSGSYSLDFGVVNWNDQIFNTGLAFDGAKINGAAIGTPEPASFALLGAALTAIAMIRRK